MGERCEPYNFIVRETTERSASVQAASRSEALALLRRWAEPGGQAGLSMEEGGPICLSDQETIRITFRPEHRPIEERRDV